MPKPNAPSVKINGKYWKVGVIGDCGNIVLTPGTPPQQDTAINVNKEVLPGNGAAVKPGDTLTYRVHFKVADGKPGFDKANNNGQPFVIADPLPANVTLVPGSQTTDIPVGFPPNNAARTKVTTFNKPESQQGGKTLLNWSYDQVLANYDFYAEFKATINANVANTTNICNFGVYDTNPSFPIITNTVCNPVNNQKVMSCVEVNTGGKTEFNVGDEIPVNGTAKRETANIGKVNFQYILLDPTTFPGTNTRVKDANGTDEFKVNGLDPDAQNLYKESLPNGAVPPAKPKFDKPGQYMIFMRAIVTDDPSNFSDGFSVPACVKTITIKPPQQGTFSCKSLTANPTVIDSPNKEVTFNAAALSQGVTISGYQFDYGDGSAKQTVNSSALSLEQKHTYAKAGGYTAKVTVLATNGTSNSPTCQVQLGQQQFTKTVSNLTLLTTDGKPTDANNQVARAGDKLQYQIGVCNATGSTIKGFIYEDDITDLLYYSDVTDLGGATKKVENGLTKLVWPAVDIPSLPSGQNCTDANGKIIPAAFAQSFKAFTVAIKNPIPATASNSGDPSAFDCSIKDDFHGNIVVTPIGVPPAKQVECASKKLPQTGAGVPIFFIAFFAASSLYLFFRNRLLKRELQLVDTLNDGGNTNG